MASIASLVVSLTAETGKFVTDTDKAARQFERNVKKMARVGTDLGRKFGLAFAAAGASLTAVVTKTAKTADEMQKLALRLGTSVEALSELSHVADLSGVQFNQLTIGLQRMERRIAEVAALGKGEAKQALEQLGLSASKLANLPVDEQFEAIAEQLSKVPTEAERVRLAFKLFDSEGVALVQTMGEGAAGIQKMREEARQLGKVISTETAGAAVEFNDNVTRLRAQLEGVGIQIASQVLPALSEFVEGLVQSGTAMRTAQSIGKGLVVLFQRLGDALAFLSNHAQATVTALGAFATLKFIPTFFATTHPLIALTAVAVGGLAASFLYLRNEAQQTQRVLASVESSVRDTTQAWIEAATAAELTARFEKLWRDAVQAGEELARVQEKIANVETGRQFEDYRGALEDWRAEEERLIQVQQNALSARAAIKSQLDDLGSATEDYSDTLDDVVVSAGRLPNVLSAAQQRLGQFVTRTKSARERLKALNDELQESFNYLNAIGQLKLDADPFIRLGREIAGFVDEVINGVDPLADMKREAEALIESLQPGRTAAQEFARQLVLLEDYADATGRSAAWLAERMRELANEFYSTANAAGDFMKVLVDESLRVLERTFSSIFEGIINDSLDAWDAIESGFKSLVSTIAQNPIRVIISEVQEAFGPGGQGFAGLDFAALGGSLISSIGNILGLSGADSIFGQIGSSLGNIFGEKLFQLAGTKFFPSLLSSLGAFAGPIGSAIGAILGSVLGDLIGGLFERDLAFTLGGPGAGTGAQRIRTPLSDVVGISGAGGFGSLNDPSTFGGQLAQALIEFDTQIANILQTIGVSDEVFDGITNALNNWVGSFGEGTDAVDVLSSRFRAILGQFSGDIQQFVNGAEDFEAQIERFGVALSVDKLIAENPAFFQGRTSGEILKIVEAFQSGAETMGQAFDEFLQVANAVIGITAVLRDFADSNPEADLAALVDGESLTRSLANVNSAILDVIASGDASVDSLQTLAQLATVAREGEIRLLEQIDSIQKGIAAQLKSLRDFITGADQAPQTISGVLAQAEGLISAVRKAQTPEDVAAIGQQFDALIRSLSEEQVFKARGDLLDLVNAFESAANLRLDTQRGQTLDNAATIRDAVDLFLAEIGDPLDIIAASLEGQNLPEVMEDGLESINQSVQQIGPQVAGALSEVFGDGINVTVVVQDAGLVTQ